MKGKTAIKIVSDALLAMLLVAVMATALVHEAPHEYLGIALFVFMVAHVVANRKRLSSFFRGRFETLRILQLILIVGLAACAIGQIISSLVLSKYAFGFLPALPGAGWARRVHMICSYWTFVLAFAHAGLHARTPKKMRPWQKWVARIIFGGLACFGAYAFVQLNMWQYLTGEIQFAYVDYSISPAWQAVRYLGAAVLIAGIFHYVRKGVLVLRRTKQRS